MTLVSGYSFGDQHLNELLFDAARRYPRSEIIVFCFSKIPAALNDLVLPNLSIYSSTEAIIGSVRRKWGTDGPVSAIIWNGGKFLLGDFANLAEFLSRSSRADRYPEAPDTADVSLEPKAS